MPMIVGGCGGDCTCGEFAAFLASKVFVLDIVNFRSWLVESDEAYPYLYTATIDSEGNPEHEAPCCDQLSGEFNLEPPNPGSCNYVRRIDIYCRPECGCTTSSSEDPCGSGCDILVELRYVPGVDCDTAGTWTLRICATRLSTGGMLIGTGETATWQPTPLVYEETGITHAELIDEDTPFQRAISLEQHDDGSNGGDTPYGPYGFCGAAGEGGTSTLYLTLEDAPGPDNSWQYADEFPNDGADCVAIVTDDDDVPPFPPTEPQCLCDCEVSSLSVEISDQEDGLCDKQFTDGTIDATFCGTNMNGHYDLTYMPDLIFDPASKKWQLYLGGVHDFADPGILLREYITLGDDQEILEVWAFRLDVDLNCSIVEGNVQYEAAIHFIPQCKIRPVAGGPGVFLPIGEDCGTPLCGLPEFNLLLDRESSECNSTLTYGDSNNRKMVTTGPEECGCVDYATQSTAVITLAGLGAPDCVP